MKTSILRFFPIHFGLLALAAFVLFAGVAQAAAAKPAASAAEKQRKLIAILKSDAPGGDKGLACKQLAVYGTKDAVPALAALLSDEQLASWARIALEAIPGSAPDKALREAMDKLQGRLLVGVINSIAVRRDAKAVSGLVKRLQDPDAEVASAAAIALGRIGGSKAGKALNASLAGAPSTICPAVAQGCVLWAEDALARGNRSQAMRMYDAVRTNDVPKEPLLEATRGAILARQSAGLSLLLEQLRSTDKALFGIGLRVARELPGRDVTAALIDELKQTDPDRQARLLLALADRNEPAVLPLVISIARTGSPQLRMAAVGILDRRGDISTVPVLLEVAATDNASLAQAAVAAIARISGSQVDDDLMARLPQSEGKARQVLIELATQRRMTQALPAMVASTKDADAGVRAAALQAIGALGGTQQVQNLVTLLENTAGSNERGNIEDALIAVSGRSGAACVPDVLLLAGNDDSPLRIVALQILASAGGSQALAAVNSAIQDKDESVRDEAARTLSTWPNSWPEDREAAGPLLELARSGQKPSYQALGLRGYLQCIRADKQLKSSQKVEKVSAVLPLLKKPEEKRLAITVIGATPTADALELLTGFAAEPAIADDACAALVNLAGKDTPGLSKDQRQKALQVAFDQSKNDETKKQAGELLKEAR